LQGTDAEGGRRAVHSDKADSSDRDIALDFLPFAQRLVMAAVKTVNERLRSLDLSRLAGWADHERTKLLKTKTELDDVDAIAAAILRDFSTKKAGLRILRATAIRRVLVLEIKRSIDSFRKYQDGDPVQYYNAKFKYLFETFSIPERCLPLIDSNLAHNMRSLSRPAHGRRAASIEHA
jgi:hypothetical protein